MEEEEEKKKKKKKGLKKDCTEVRGKNGKESGLDVTVARMQGVPVGGLAMRVGWTERDEQGWRKAGVAVACG